MGNIPQNYITLSAQQTKNPVVVVQIAGVSDLFTNSPLSTRVLYGDPNVKYGDPGIVYGGLRPYVVTNADGSLSTFQPLLDLNTSSLTIGQRLEPEQGKSSVSTLSLSFIDYQGYMTQLVSPGVILPEILGSEVTVYLGYTQISFPGDFFQVFRGYISSVDDGPGNVILQLSDPNIKRRQTLFYCSQSTLTADITSTSQNSFQVLDNGAFFAQIVAADGSDYAIGLGGAFCHCYVQIDDEWIECQPSALDSTTMLVLGYPFPAIGRGARGTTAATHSAGAQVNAAIQLGDDANPQNAMDMALQIMLSGWNGPWVSGIALTSIGPQPDTNPSINTTDFIVLPAGVDAVEDYALVAGDWIILSGSSISANNNTYLPITRFGDLNGTTNRVIFLSDTWLGSLPLFKEINTPATVSFRSQYDVLPVDAGLALTNLDVDIDQHQAIKNTFLGGAGNDLIFFLTAQVDSGKDFLESQVYFPKGAYSLTRRGLLSCGYHSPPIGNQNLAVLNSDNILEPNTIRITRALNQRAFFNEIDVTYNYDDAGDSLASLVFVDADSVSSSENGGIGITSALPLDSQGITTINPDGSTRSNASATLLKLSKTAYFLLTRYKRGAVMFQIKVNWQVGSTIEAGDIVTIQDNGTLQLANFNTGQRSLDQQLFEVIDRTFDIKGGNVSLKLVGGVGATLTDRFATISPSSLIIAGSTSTAMIIQDSFGALYPGNESKKWENYIGLPILVHSQDYSVSGQCTLISIDETNNYLLHTTDVGFTPSAGYVIDIAPYPTSTDSTINGLYKIMHAFWTPTVTVVSGVDTSNFTVGSGDIGKFSVGRPIRVHSINYTNDSTVNSVDLTVSEIVGNQITTSGSMGFTPSAGNLVDLIGFADFVKGQVTGQPYRWL